VHAEGIAPLKRKRFRMVARSEKSQPLDGAIPFPYWTGISAELRGIEVYSVIARRDHERERLVRGAHLPDC
jgi:hypothetical protein